MKAFIDTEKHFVREEHTLRERLLACEMVLAHLLERIPESDESLSELHGEIVDKIVEIGELLNSSELKDVGLAREEQHLWEKLEKDVEHKDWRAVKKDISKEESKEKKVLRLEIDELRKLHTLFKELVELMEKDRSSGGKTTAEGKTWQYFVQIHKLIKAYEQILWHLLKKEEMLAKKIGKETT